MKKFFRTNQQIRADQVLVIEENGEKKGVMSVLEGIELAKERDLDLVEVAPNTRPPVCKIMNFGKFKYEQEKSQRKHRSKQKIKEDKEIRLSLKIKEHDLLIKRKKAEDFLQKGHQVKISLRLLGREMQRQDKAFMIIEQVCDDLKKVGKIATPPIKEHNFIFATLIPKKS